MTEDPRIAATHRTMPGANEKPLESWKEIAAYLNRDVRTVTRWEKSERLPVHRHQHQARSSVYAYPSELDAWRALRRPSQDAELGVLWRLPARAVALVTMLIFTFLSAGGGLVTPLSTAAQGQGTVNHLVWSGANVDPLCTPSPDGRYLAMTDWNSGDLALRDLQTGEIRRLTANRNWEGFAEFPVYSPDGKQIAFSWYEKGTRHLRIFSLETSTARVAYANKQVDYAQAFAWSPDGSQLLALLKRVDGVHQIAFISVADGSARVLKTMDWRGTRTAALSPDGRWIAYDFRRHPESPESDIFLLAGDGSSETLLVGHPANDLVMGWTPDGSRVLFTSDRTGRLGIWSVPVGEGKAQGAPELVRADVPPLWPRGFTRSGEFYYGVPTGMMDVYLATLDPLTGAVVSAPSPLTERFVGANRAPDWSPDGKSVVYASQVVFSPSAAPARITVRALETGEERELSPKLQQILRNPRWSPDGRFLLLQGRDDKGRAGFFRVDIETGEAALAVREKAPGYLQFASWAPDGKSVYYLSTSPEVDNRLFRRDLQSGKDYDLGRSTSNYAVSPDGRRLVIRIGDAAEKATSLAIVPVEGGEPRELLRIRAPESLPSWSGLAWTPDGKHILYTLSRDENREQPFELWRIPSEGGTPQKTGIAMKQLRELRVHPDGKTIVFGAGLNTFEIWVMENFLPAIKAAK
jgi:Tol biopolymer transport system component